MKQGPWILCGGLLLGMALGTLSYLVPFPSVIFLGAGMCLVILRTFPKSDHPFLLVGFILFLSAFWYGQSHSQYFTDLESKRAEAVTYRVSGIPEAKDFYQAVILKPLERSLWWQHPPKVLWQAPLSVGVVPGEKITLTCDLALPENFTPDFNYRLYLAKERIGYLCEEAHSFQPQEGDRVTRALHMLYTPRKLLERGVHASIPEPEAGLAKGLLLGGSSHLSSITQEQFTRLGLTHIVAVSGYNIVLIVNVLLVAGLALHLWRKQATLLAFFGTAFFIFMIGAPASAVRAGIMAFAAFGAFLIGRVQYSLLAVCFSAALMTLWNPLYLWYDAGFQLSFLATIAVIVAMRAVEAKLSPQKMTKAFQEIIWLSVWVYLFLLPLLLYQFQIFTVLSIPANILFLPVVPFAMLGSFVSAVTTLILPAASVIVGWIAYVPLTYITRGTYALSHFPAMTVPAHISLATVIAWYSIILFVLIHAEERRAQKHYEKNFQCSKSSHRH